MDTARLVSTALRGQHAWVMTLRSILDRLTIGWMTSMSDAIDAAFDVDDPLLADDPADLTPTW